MRVARSAHRQRAIAVGLVAAFSIGAGFAAAAAVRDYRVATHPMHTVAEGTSVEVTVSLTGDPHRLPTPGFDGSARVLVAATLREARIGHERVRAGGSVVVLAPADGWTQLLPGQRVQFRGTVASPLRRDLTVVVLRTNAEPTQVFVPPIWQRLAGTVRARFAEASRRALPEEAGALLPALVVGDTSALPATVTADFKAAGLAHLTAVSGTNVSILLGAVLLAVRGAALGPRTGAAIAALALVAFVVLARPSPSVLRAAVMGAIALLALITSRRKQAMPALGAAVVGLLAVQPALAVDMGFALSVAATTGLILIAPSWTDWLQARGSPRALAEAVAVSAAAFAVTAPIVAALSGTVSLVAIAANLAVAVVITPITVLGAVVAVLAAVWVPLGVLVAHAAAPPMWWLLFVAHRVAALPGATVAVPPGVAGGLLAAIAVIAVLVGLRSVVLRRLAAAVLIGVAAVYVPTRLHPPGWPPQGWSMVACDVGQGDGLVLAAGSAGAVVVDAGPDEQAMSRCLDRLRIQHIALVVLSHLHADHIGGLAGVLHDRSVGAVAVGPMHLPVQAYAHVASIAGASRTPLVQLSAGQRLRVGSLQMQVLGPLLPAPTDPADGDDAANDQSLVLAVDAPAGRILLPGDAEAPAQQAMMRAGAPLRADVLKVPHHGSRTTANAFLDAVRPRVALVSVGAENTFGHPAAVVIDRLHTDGAVVGRSDRQGDIAVTGSAGRLAVVARHNGRDPPRRADGLSVPVRRIDA